MRYKPGSFLDNPWLSFPLHSFHSLSLSLVLPLPFNAHFLPISCYFCFYVLHLSALLPPLPPPNPPSSLGHVRPSVFQMKRWAVCVMWWTRRLLSCFMSQCSLYVHDEAPSIVFLDWGSKIYWRYRHLHTEMNWRRTGYSCVSEPMARLQQTCQRRNWISRSSN